MSRKKLSALATTVALGSMMGVAWGGGQTSLAQVVRGQAEVRQADGAWVAAQGFGPGQTIRSQKDNTTVSLPGATIRLESGSQLAFKQVGDRLQMFAKNGRVFVSLDKDVVCELESAKKNIVASGSEFAVDGNTGKLFVLSGNARVDGEPATGSEDLRDWAKGQGPSGGSLGGEVAATDDNSSNDDEEDGDSTAYTAAGIGVGAGVAIAVIVANSGSDDPSNFVRFASP
ncbi:hypothetical protein JST97_07445 [bacterium]|nr:hypothetical protein [bacterium]